ncbi:serine hydrolase domain-containing protein [Solicola gregarius]|uniref:Beta-lactamase family protein n=1 Tax=Solicola gregarius TaxID=2908642 RepID=A0AA46TM40_9ACTN|nr:serine hydrolase domain-containing protein [Solicola gregarius]UYM07580.1 beta-lactamase family protein [Solicola gregarius]
MTRFIALVALATLLASACTTAGESPPDDSPQQCAATYADGLDAWAAAGFSGTVAISTGGTFDCVAGYGAADRDSDRTNAPDTVYSIGSISKAFTAAAIFRLVDTGRLRLGDRAGAIIPALHGLASRATVRQLLLHTSGLTGSIGADHAPLGRETAIRRLGRLHRAYAPGSHYLYSNAGYTLLALIIDKLAGKGYRGFMASQVLRTPDGVRSRGFWDGEPAARGPRAVGYLDGGPTEQLGDFAGPHWALSGNGDLAMTTHDLASWTHALFDGDVVSRTSTRGIARAGIDRGDGTSATPGWVRFPASAYGEPVIATSGGGGDIGHDAVVAWLPRSERAVAIASNTPVVRAEDLLTAIAPALVEGDPVPPPKTPAGSADPAELRAAVGTYHLDPGDSFGVAVRDDELDISAHGRRAVEALFPRPASVSADTASTHEAAVLDLLQGATDEGRKERELFESDFGAITDLALSGTAVIDGELRTYITVRTASESVLGWYALDESGAISAAEIPTDPPHATFVPVGGDRYQSDDPTGDEPAVTVTFTKHDLALGGPDGTVRAERAGR